MDGLARFQALFRGQRARKLHVTRVQKDLPWSPYLPCKPDAAATMLALAKAGPRDTLLDIGSGDGRVVFAAVEPPFGVAKAIGVDIDDALVRHAQKDPRCTSATLFLLSDWVDVDLSGVSVITLFFLPHKSIATLLRAKCKPGTRVVTYVFPIADWTPVATATTVAFLSATGTSPVYLYLVPA
ncbi:hypothetical protein SPRG_20119 [Saprolegnia parasitica CBS 223.65]|uniref:Methyltransferase domain-containing protein n=1 Tax=Saprolegnia parasitica (strain CBS 223.65) TaxID=695850 RepID=A0A067CIR3_SAPPC|nr:hypothetical protein SPRG_20119 [Saprolegnia parasitica CBS 223.65]KDO29075.1 hypothetical protein SPRG_20119 [Saprolegnia parasitica CBS 223.65]|eukprot:XP_012200341.1 hypothetical protein SPRG_20119 [Saprolegnia parasitica CBS 223.65]